MNSSKTAEWSVFFYRSVLHPLISIGVTMLFTANLLFMLEFVLQMPPGTPPFFPVLLFLVSLSAVILGNIFYGVRVGTFARIRETVVILLATYLYTSVFFPGPFPERFAFRPIVLIPLIFTFLQWYLTVEIQKRLRGREDFILLIEGRTGADLQNRLRDYQPFAAEVVHDLQGLKTFLNGMLVLLTLGILLCVMTAMAITVAIVLSFIVFTVFCLMLQAMLSAFMEEFGYYGEGVAPTRDDFRRRFGIAGIMLFAGFLIASAMSSDASILPLSLITDFLNFLASLFPSAEGEAEPYLNRETGPDPMLELLKAQQRDSVMPDWVPVLFNVLKYAALSALALFLLYRFLKPFFSTEFRSYLGKMHPLRILLERLKMFVAWLRSLFTGGGDRKKLLAWEREAGPGYGETSSMAISEEKRRETNQVIRAFLKVLKWGRKQGTSYALGQTPAEYAGIILRTFPRLEADFTLIVQVFEEALFSSHLLGTAATGEYFDRVRAVISTRKPKPTDSELTPPDNPI